MSRAALPFAIGVTAAAFISAEGGCAARKDLPESSDDGHAGAADAGACVDAGPGAVDAGYAYAPERADPGLPSCPMRCGASSRGGVYSVADLPSGACAGTQACRAGAERPCNCGEGVQGPVSGFRCDCVGGQWSCAITSLGTAVCPVGCGKDGG